MQLYNLVEESYVHATQLPNSKCNTIARRPIVARCARLLRGNRMALASAGENCKRAQVGMARSYILVVVVVVWKGVNQT